MATSGLAVEYPALYRAADDASNRAQATLLRSYQANAALLVVAAIVALFSGTRALAVLSALLFVASLAAHVFAETRGFQKRWYQARALAESVKTTTWRFMMNADPFTGAATDYQVFRDRLRELLSQNEGIASELSGEWADKDQISAAMVAAHSAPFEARHAFYLEARIDEQRTWYAKKALANKKSSQKFFAGICLIYGVAIALVLVRIASPTAELLPIEAIAVVASSLIGWTQLRRFDDLASAYSLTAHEVGIIRSRFDEIADLAALGGFVSDSENAFSREHTQWTARRDHIR